MAIIATPSDFTTGATAAQLNTLKDTIYDEFNGNIDTANLKAAAGILPAQIADGAVTKTGSSEQVITQPTEFSSGAFKFNGTSSDVGAITTPTGAGVTIAKPAGKTVIRLSFGGATDINKMTGGAAGDVVIISLVSNATINHLSAGTADDFVLTTGASITGTLPRSAMFMCGDLDVSGFNKWWQI